jgi:NhaP-type Na+/H+ or K+/H+ antiporter
MYPNVFFLLLGCCICFNLFSDVQEQFIMSYGGLRGAVGFSLVKLIDKSIVPSAGIFVTATLAVIMSTVFIQVLQQKHGLPTL